MFTKSFILLCISISFFTISHGQKNFQPGYVITYNKDTLKGSIDFRHWDQNPKKIIFKDSIKGQTVNYHPIDIIKFKVVDESYESAIVNVDKSSDKAEDLNYSQQFTFTKDTAFLYVLAEGNKSLFSYKDSDGKEHFFIKENDSLELLLYKTYLKESEPGNSVIASNNDYLKQLSRYFRDCPAIQSKLSDLKYTQSGLAKIFADYYTCTNTATANKNKVKKNSNNFGITAGFSSTTIKFSGTAFSYLTKTSYPTSIKPAAGIFYNLYLDKRLKFSFYNELLFTSFKANGFYKESYQGDDIYDTYTFILDYSYINLKTMLRFSYPVRTVLLYASAGASNGFVVSEKNILISQRKTYSQTSTVNGEAVMNSRKYEQALIAGVGCRLKKVSLEARFENGNGMSNASGLGSSVKRLFILLAYNF